jgi:hypothetical protein
MQNNYYKFITKWQIKAPLNDVWFAIYESSEWPAWWKGVKAVTVIKENDANGINGIRRYTWKAALPYTLSFSMQLTEKQDLSLLKGIAFGKLEGDGTWHFSHDNGITKVQYNWNVKTNKPWMNYLAFLLKPLFQLNHNIVMKWGAVSLARKLNAELIST